METKVEPVAHCATAQEGFRELESKLESESARSLPGEGDHFRAELLNLRRKLSGSGELAGMLLAKTLEKINAKLDDPALNLRHLLSIGRLLQALRSTEAKVLASIASKSARSKPSDQPGEPSQLSPADRQAMIDLARGDGDGSQGSQGGE
jgi:hypothetical protein